MPTIEDRFAALERSVKRWRHATVGLVLVIAVGGTVAAALQPEIPAVIKARRFEVVDRDGNCIVEVGTGNNGLGFVAVWPSERDESKLPYAGLGVLGKGGIVMVNSADGRRSAVVAAGGANHGMSISENDKVVSRVGSKKIACRRLDVADSYDQSLVVLSGSGGGGSVRVLSTLQYETVWGDRAEDQSYLSPQGLRTSRYGVRVCTVGIDNLRPMREYDAPPSGALRLWSETKGFERSSREPSLVKGAPPEFMTSVPPKTPPIELSFKGGASDAVATVSKMEVVQDVHGRGGVLSVRNKAGENVVTLEVDEDGNGKVGVLNRKGEGRTLKPGP